MRNRFPGPWRAGFIYQDWLLFCFLLGILGGTAAVLAFGDSLVMGGILGAAGQPFFQEGNGAWAEAFFRVFRQRAAEVCAGWLAGLTICSRALFGAFTCGVGLCLGAALSVLTARKGLLGLPVFLGSVLPQGLIYGAVWAVLARWAEQREKKVHVLAGLMLLAGTGIGAWIEVWMGTF